MNQQCLLDLGDRHEQTSVEIVFQRTNVSGPTGTLKNGHARRRMCSSNVVLHRKDALPRMHVVAWVVMVVAWTVQATNAQLPHARLNWVFPTGGQVGTEFEVSIGGIDLDDAREILFSDSGITARPKMTEPSVFQPEPQPIPNVFVVSISSGTPPGIHEARVVGHYGISNPRAFMVGQLEEMNESGGNESPGKATSVALETTINGRAEGVKAGFYRLDLKLGQRVMLNLWAQRIDSQMDATLSVCNENGETIVTSRDEYGRDPFLDFTAPADGLYLVKVFDFVFEGGSERFYRLSVSAAPFVEYLFPPALSPGDSRKLTLFGRNLPGGRPSEDAFSNGKRLEQLEVEVSASDATALAVPRQYSSFVRPSSLDLSGFVYRYQTDQGASNPVWICYATAPVVQEQEPNNHAGQAQDLKVPCEVVGQFHPRGDDDWVQFQARKGDVFWLDVFSHRLGLPTDPFLLVQRINTNPEGTETVEDIAEIDDSGPRPGGPVYDLPSNDPTYQLTVDQDATYRVLVRDLYVNSVSSPRHIYRMSIRRPQPDFRLLIAPHSPWNAAPAQPQRWNSVLRRGSITTLRVLAIRRDGFNGDIRLTVTGLPPTVTTHPVTLRSGAAEILLVFEVAEDAPAWHGPIQVLGRAKIGDAEVVRQAYGGTIVWDGATARLTPDFALAVTEERVPVAIRTTEDKKWEVPREGKLSIPFRIDRQGDLKGNLELKPLGLPGGVTAVVTIAADTNGGSLDLEVAGSAPTGDYRLLLEGKPKVSYRRNPEAVQRVESLGKKLAVQLAKVVEDNNRAIEALKMAEATAQESAGAVTLADSREVEAEQQLEVAQQALAAAQKYIESVTEPADDVIQKAADRSAQAATNTAKAILNRDEARREAVEAGIHFKMAEAVRVDAAAAASDAAAKVKAAEEISTKTTDLAKKLTEQANPKDESMYVVSVPIMLSIQEAAK
jgi:hypothetical protein